MKNFIYGAIGFLFIGGSLLLLFTEAEGNILNILSGLVMGTIFIYPIFKKDDLTDVEKFVASNNIMVVIWWKRVCAFLVDYIIIGFIYTFFVLLLRAKFGIRLDKFYNPIALMTPFYIFYFLAQEYLYQTTLGKLIFQLKVISAKDGSAPTFLQVFIRLLARIIPLNLLAFLSKRPIGLHDILSKTVVIKK